MIAHLLMGLKLGLYAPSSAPFSTWFYLSQRIGIAEIGGTVEYVKRPASLLGLQGYDQILVPAFMGGVRKSVSQDLDIAAGVKVRPYDRVVLPYVSIGLKLGAVNWSMN